MTEQEAIQRFQNLNFVKDLNQTLQNQYFGTKVPVDPNTEKAVAAEMVVTHQSLQQRIMQTNNLTTKEDTKMSFDPKPVSLEEYNQSLRGTVNAYYEHAINDPSMSKEEAIKSTAEMSETYLDAVQEFQEAQDMQNGVVVSENESVQSTEPNGFQTDNNALDTTDIQGNNVASVVDAGVFDDGVSDGGVDNDSAGVDDGMDV